MSAFVPSNFLFFLQPRISWNQMSGPPQACLISSRKSFWKRLDFDSCCAVLRSYFVDSNCERVVSLQMKRPHGKPQLVEFVGTSHCPHLLGRYAQYRPDSSHRELPEVHVLQLAEHGRKQINCMQGERPEIWKLRRCWLEFVRSRLAFNLSS